MQKTIREWDANGFRCLITQPAAGPLRCYSGVPEGHPLYGASLEQARAEVVVSYAPDDKGVTYAGELPADSYAESHGLWWFGFDALSSETADSFERSVGECEHLAEQLWIVSISREPEEEDFGPESLCKLLGGPLDGEERLIPDGVDAFGEPIPTPAGYPAIAGYVRSPDEFEVFIYTESQHPSRYFLSGLPPA